MKKVTHSKKSIRNLFRSQSAPQEQNSHSEPSVYPNYGQLNSSDDGFVESSVGHEDPLHFYGPPPEPPRFESQQVDPLEWCRAGTGRGTRRGIRIDQQAQASNEHFNRDPQYRAQDYHSQNYYSQDDHSQDDHSQDDHSQDDHSQDDHSSQEPLQHQQDPRHDQPQYQPSVERPRIVAQPSDQPNTTAPNVATYNGQAADAPAAESRPAQLAGWVRSGAARFRGLQTGGRSWRVLALRGGIVAAALIILFGGWLRFFGPSATADQAGSASAGIDSSLAILASNGQPAAQNSVADGLAILSAQPAANESADGEAVTVGDLIVSSAGSNAGDANTTSTNTTSTEAAQPQTVAQALAAASTFTPTPIPTQTPTPLPTFTPTQTPTPTPIPTEEIPDEIPQVNLIGSILDNGDSEADDEPALAAPQVQRAATPTITPTPLPLSPGRLWSTFQPGPPAQTDHFWIGRPFFASAKTQIASTNYQFGSTASSRYRVHYGLDISNPMGTDVRAATTGQVIHAGPDDPILLGPYNNFYGNAVVIQLDQRLPVAGGELDVFVLYGHLNTLNVQVGDRVEPDDIIGFVGMRGIALGPHLHVEVRLGANTYNHIVNPYLWLEPVQGTGAIAVRLLTADGRTWRSARVSLLRLENGRSAWSRYIETYSDDGYLGPDPAWGENGAMGSLKPGTYQVISVLNGERVKVEVQVRAGETTFVELRSKQ